MDNDRYFVLHDETQKRIGTTLLVYSILIFLAFVVTFSNALQEKDYILIPIIAVKMNQWNSVEVLCLLDGVAIFRLAALYSYLMVLKEILKDEGSLKKTYPTLVSIIGYIRGLDVISPIMRIGSLAVVMIPVMGLFLVSGLMRAKARMSRGLNAFGVSWWMIAAALIIITIASCWLLCKNSQAGQVSKT
jgi:hypothetical protein